jgi:hypothetical protein
VHPPLSTDKVAPFGGLVGGGSRVCCKTVGTSISRSVNLLKI